MSNIQFDEQSYTTPTHSPYARNEKGITGFLIKNGIAKDPRQAGLMMIGMTVVLLLISFFAIKSASSDDVFNSEPDPFPMEVGSSI